MQDTETVSSFYESEALQHNLCAGDGSLESRSPFSHPHCLYTYMRSHSLTLGNCYSCRGVGDINSNSRAIKQNWSTPTSASTLGCHSWMVCGQSPGSDWRQPDWRGGCMGMSPEHQGSYSASAIAVWPYGSLDFLSLSFLLCKMEIIVLGTVAVRVKQDYAN